MSEAPEHGIGTRTMRGMAWAYGSYVGGRVLVLASTAVLARLLTPEDFGVVALAITFMALLEGFSDLGLSAALVIQDEERLAERAQTVFVTSVALGAVLTVIIAALAPFMAEFFHEPELTGIAAALGCNFFLRSLGSTHYAHRAEGARFQDADRCRVRGRLDPRRHRRDPRPRRVRRLEPRDRLPGRHRRSGRHPVASRSLAAEADGEPEPPARDARVRHQDQRSQRRCDPDRERRLSLRRSRPGGRFAWALHARVSGCPSCSCSIFPSSRARCCFRRSRPSTATASLARSPSPCATR